MISETNRFVRRLENLDKNDADVAGTITIRITTPKSVDADKACHKFIREKIKEFEKDYKKFVKKLDKELKDE